MHALLNLRAALDCAVVTGIAKRIVRLFLDHLKLVHHNPRFLAWPFTNCTRSLWVISVIYRLRYKNNGRANSILIAAVTFTLVDAIALAALSHLEHQHSARPSNIILVYLAFSIALDSVQCRTLWPVKEDVVTLVYTAVLGIKSLAILLELKEKRSILLPPWNCLSLDMTGSNINTSLFWWLNDLLIWGFRATLSGTSLYDTDTAMKSRRLLSKVQAA